MLNSPRSKLLTSPAIEPVSLEEIKEHLRITHDDDDLLLTELISAARHEFESVTGLALISQAWRCWYDAPLFGDGLGWWDGVREGMLPKAAVPAFTLAPSPVLSLTSVKFYSISDVETVWSESNYQLDAISRPGRVAVKSNAQWPTSLRSVNAFAIDLTAGFGATENDVPADIRHAIKMMAAFRYDHRGESLSSEALAALQDIFRPILRRYKLLRL